MNFHLLERIETCAENFRYYGDLTIEMLEHELKTYPDPIFAAAMICGYYSDQDGGEAGDELYDSILEEILEISE